jgi:hypothetical protein
MSQDADHHFNIYNLALTSDVPTTVAGNLLPAVGFTS